MLRNILALVILITATRPGWAVPADEASEMLARAEALYYEADFAKSIELLLRADELISGQAGRLEERTAVKLHLALGYIGLNDSTRGKAYLKELYALDSDHRIDAQAFSPKVIRLAEEAKAEQNELRCRSLLDETERQLGSGKSDPAVKLIASNVAKCPGLAALNAKSGELLFKEGMEAYKKAQMGQALEKFQAALRFNPKHELATEYVDLAQNKLELAAGRGLLAWRKDFTAGEFALAARDYRELLSLNSSQAIEEVRTEYRRALSGLADSWNKACKNDDVAGMEDARRRVDALIPVLLEDPEGPSFAEDIQATMKTCAHTRCVQMTSPLALSRLKNRVDPQFPPYLLSLIKDFPMTIRVKARINEAGDVAAAELSGGNALVYDAVRSAFGQWKFSPALLQGEARCVDTEIPIVLKFGQR
jgi:tetratricopeptide (TPR) repeat protein